jgi:hypothetical protein
MKAAAVTPSAISCAAAVLRDTRPGGGVAAFGFCDLSLGAKTLIGLDFGL